jgi:hypothetical protein
MSLGDKAGTSTGFPQFLSKRIQTRGFERWIQFHCLGPGLCRQGHNFRNGISIIRKGLSFSRITGFFFNQLNTFTDYRARREKQHLDCLSVNFSRELFDKGNGKYEKNSRGRSPKK